ncbi:AraC family transcriptional regulator [Paenibacillus sp. R14(2021)]|uniref:helix-turn-helix domain-containing protein n=1 Tax=Paenibacillus sp. R14(2021) TaxID=2859228 RepID=UPI001C612223|nr:AraC family transcriptional regulator [Paenibacillus sp. R14(2021)]
MKLTYKTIIQNYFHRFQAEVSMAAYSRMNPGWQPQQMPEFYRLWFIQEGSGGLRLNERSVELKPGQLLLLPPGAVQSFGSNFADAVGLHWCHFRASIGDMELFDLLNLPICVMPEEQEHLTWLFQRLIEAYRSTLITRELRIRAVLFAILASYLDYVEISEDSIRRIEPIEKIDRVLEYIEQHLSEAISVEDMARLAFLHPNYFIGYFKNIVGFAPTQYVNIRRLERAKKLLEQEEYSISEIARQVGMQNYYLSRQFKHYTGLTPSRYKQIYYQSVQGTSFSASERSEDE